MSTITPNAPVAHPEPKPCNLPGKEIEQIGSRVASMLDYEIGSELEPIVKRLGGHIEYQDVDAWLKDRSDEIVVKLNGSFVIYLSNFSGLLRDRFTIAHEIGHFVLHSNMGKLPIRVQRHGTGLIETEANRFAAGFLMPEDEFKKAAARTRDPEQLASIFRVSSSAVEIRLKSLRLD